MGSTYRQDMPPEGGYGVIDVARKPARRFFSNRAVLLGFIGISTLGYIETKFKINRANERFLEKDNTIIALEPFLAAENDRAYLKQLIINLEEETKLMKNVPGWKVGTLFGKKFYSTIPADRLPPARLTTFYAHRPSDEAFQNLCPERAL